MVKYSIRNFWDREESLTIFLGLLLAFVFLIGPLALAYPGLKLLGTLLFTVVLVTGLFATLESAGIASIASVLGICAIGVALLREIYDGKVPLGLTPEVFELPALGLILYVVLHNTLKKGPVTIHRIKGAIAAYLMLALLWAKMYNILIMVSPGAISGVDQLDPLPSLVYYSFVTLSTLGYGDILPVHIFARTLACAEALVGQLFPAVFIARLVGLEIEQRKNS